MKKLLIIVILLLGLSSASYAIKPPKVETLPDGYLIVGQYMIYRTQLTQDNFDGAMMTTSDVQKIYYKSEFAEGTWFNLDESQELVEILLDGGGQSVSDEWLNTFTFSVQIDEDGKIIKFTEGDNVQTIEAFINALKSEQAALENDLEDLAGDKAEEIAAQASDLAVRISALNKTIGIDDSEKENKKLLLELLTQAQDSGNKMLEEAIQKELASLNPKLSDPEVLIDIAKDLLKEKEDLLALKDQAKRNGFEVLLEAIAVELESKEALLEEALENAKEAVAASRVAIGDATGDGLGDDAGTTNINDALEAVLQASIELDLLNETQVLVGYESVIEAIDGVIDDLLTSIADKVILDTAGPTLSMANLIEEVPQIENEIIEDVLERLVDTEASMLDPLSTKAIMDKNLEFSFEEIETLTLTLGEELFSERQENIQRERLLMTLLSEQAIGKQTVLLNEIINKFMEIIDLSNTRVIESGLEAEIESELIELANLYGGLNQPMMDLFESNNKLKGHRSQKRSLVFSIEQFILGAKATNRLELVEDLKTLKTYLLEVSNELNRRDYDDYMDYLKRRYYLLKDYSSDKEKALDTSITDYTVAIAELDKLIYEIQSRKLVDIEEINLDFEAWRLSFDGTVREQEDAKLALKRYRDNKNTEIKSSIEETKDQIGILNQLILLLESTDLSNDAVEYRITVLKDVIDQTKDLLDQLNEYYNF